MMKRMILAAAMIAAMTGGAAATDGYLAGMNGGAHVFVWKDVAARDEGFRLIQAGVHRSNPAMIMRLIACETRTGTRVVITSAGWATHDVIVIDGPASGCRGNIAAEEFTRHAPPPLARSGGSR